MSYYKNQLMHPGRFKASRLLEARVAAEKGAEAIKKAAGREWATHLSPYRIDPSHHRFCVLGHLKAKELIGEGFGSKQSRKWKIEHGFRLPDEGYAQGELLCAWQEEIIEHQKLKDLLANFLSEEPESDKPPNPQPA